MKLDRKRASFALALSLALVPALIIFAQDAPRPGGPGGPGTPGGPGGPGEGPGRRPPVMLPIIAALDANHDGVIDAKEIDNAPAALRTLDKNNDGQLSMDELRPARGPGGPGGPGGGPGGPPPSRPNRPPPQQ